MVVRRKAAMGPVAPTLVYEDVGRAIDWLCDTFGFTERFRYGPEGDPDGAQLAAGEGTVFLTRARVGQSPDWDNRKGVMMSRKLPLPAFDLLWLQ